MEIKQRSRKEGVPEGLWYVGAEQPCMRPSVSTMSSGEDEAESADTGLVQSLQLMQALKTPIKKMFSKDALCEPRSSREQLRMLHESARWAGGQ